ncbi:site-2 protease family protein [Microbacterium sp. NPDC076911]|uniref:M50 family metallopeptidase n=1 Tax=Microbacterium sp. NPDC076911 TaxID=3154958 RepID=UPI00341D39A1
MEVIAFIIGVVLMVVGLAVSIALHEIGHLVPAKKFGVRVGQYMVGFGPTLWSKRKGETEYGVKAIPLGGYISMAGMYPPSPNSARAGRAGGGFFATMVQDARAANDETLVGDDDQRVFYKLPVYKRVIIMLGGPFMNLVLAIVLFTILLSGIGVQTATTTIGSVSECIPADSTRTECVDSDPAAPAAAAGLQAGDEIIAINGAEISTFTEVSTAVRDSADEPIEVVVLRDDAEYTIVLTPAAVERQVVDADGLPVVDANGEPETSVVGIVGISPVVDFQRQPVWSGAQMAATNVGAVAGIIWQLPVRIWETGVDTVTGQERDPDGPLSVVGVSVIAGEVAAAEAPILNRVSALLSLLASLNIALFVFNLVPLLPLDGGHIAVALWDGVKRMWAKIFRLPPPKPVDATKLVPVTFVVVVALIAMGAVLILSDLINPMSLF